MEIGRKWKFSCLLLGLFFLATSLQDVQGEVESEGPSESECRPYIEKALKGLEAGDTEPADDPGSVSNGESVEDLPVAEATTDDSGHADSAGEHDIDKRSTESTETQQNEEAADKSNETQEQNDSVSSENNKEQDTKESLEATSSEVKEGSEEKQEDGESTENNKESTENAASKEDSIENEIKEDEIENVQENAESTEKQASVETEDDTKSSEKTESVEKTESAEKVDSAEKSDSGEKPDGESVEKNESVEENAKESIESIENTEAVAESAENTETAESVEKVDNVEFIEETASSAEVAATSHEDTKEESKEDDSKTDEASQEAKTESTEVEATEPEVDAEAMQGDEATKVESVESVDAEEVATQNDESDKSTEDTSTTESLETNEEETKQAESAEEVKEGSVEEVKQQSVEEVKEESVEVAEEIVVATIEEPVETETELREEVPEEDLTIELEIPEDLRPRDHIEQLLKLDEDNTKSERVMKRVAEVTLKELKKLYENAIKPLETLYKYRDLSNRHFGDSEIFSKPLVLFMGPWSGGKSSIINYLTDNEFNSSSLRTGAEPSPAYFNLLMYGDEPEVLDGTQLAADFTFAGLQKFGEGLEDRLRGLKLPSKLLEKINIVEIPGILEVRKQISRVFPFNDACQWFIDRADIIFLVYDPSKLDVGPETEAILDQLKGREHQTRIILNKADQVKPEELMRVQGALIWNISPLMSSAQPPVMYTTSLWSRPYETWAPMRLLHAQERAFLRDLRSAVDKRIENKISSARRFAVRVRNHAKMVDCYLTTYYNHKSVFGNRKQVADQIIEHPQDYHIYEGLSTLTNISRYDLPDPDVYRDFFRLNALYDFQQLSATCTYFRGCPINRLDVAIAYDFPELVGKHKKLVEAALAEIKTES